MANTSSNYLDRYPYQTLYDNKGICTEKAYLASAIIGKMGYGTSLFEFKWKDKEIGHMTLGLKVDKKYGSYNSEYAIYDVTSDPSIYPGAVAYSMDEKGRPTIIQSKIETLDSNSGLQVPDFGQSTFAEAKVYIMNEGNPYLKISKIKELENSVIKGLSYLNVLKSNIAKAEANVSSNKASVDTWKLKMQLASDSARQCVGFSAIPSCYEFYDYYKNSMINLYNISVQGYNKALSNQEIQIKNYNETLTIIRGQLEQISQYNK